MINNVELFGTVKVRFFTVSINSQASNILKTGHREATLRHIKYKSLPLHYIIR